MRRLRLSLLVLLCALPLAVVSTFALAQAGGVGGVSESGMEQGEARIGTRNDVTMAIKSGPGTSGRRLQTMAGVVSGGMGDVRSCYADIIEKRPTVTGQIALRIRLKDRGKPEVEKLNDTTEDAPLLRCVRLIFAKLNYAEAERPAIVDLEFKFGNSAAAGVTELRRRRAEGTTAAVQTDEDGKFFADGRTDAGEVTFRLKTLGPTSEAAIGAMYLTLRDNVAGMLDCRRRASRNDMNPEGTFSVRVAVPRAGRNQIIMRKVEIEDPRGSICLERAIKRIRAPKDAAGRYDLEVKYAPRQPMDTATGDEQDTP